MQNTFIKIRHLLHGWRLMHIANVTLIVILASALAALLLAENDTPTETLAAIPKNRWQDMTKPSDNGTELFDLALNRTTLFKSASPIQDRPVADATIERIKSQLKLQCIMKMAGQPVAYIDIANVGLKRCGIGDQVNDLFTVTDIGTDSVELLIVEHKVHLSL